VGGRLRGVGTVNELIGEHIEWVDLVVYFDTQTPPVEFSEFNCLHQEGNILRFRLQQEEVSVFLEQLQRSGGELKELTPHRKTLEAVLVDEMKRSGGSQS
jgi:hypothetical protein